MVPVFPHRSSLRTLCEAASSRYPNNIKKGPQHFDITIRDVGMPFLVDFAYDGNRTFSSFMDKMVDKTLATYHLKTNIFLVP